MRSARRSTLQRIFVSQDEPRLRVGWRLLIYTFLLFTLVFTAEAILTIGLYVAPITNLPFEVESVIRGAVYTVAITLATWIARRWLDHRDFLSIGFEFDHRSLSDLIAGFLLTALMMGAIYAIELAMGWVHFERWAWQIESPLPVIGRLSANLGVFIAVGYYEELLFRGYLLQNLAEGLNLFWGVTLSSLVFGLAHVGNPNAVLVSSLGVFAAGCFLAFGWLRTRALWLPIGLHIGWNFFEGNVFGFPVSGNEVFTLIQQNQSGPVLFTGGKFGPEAGLVLLPAIGVGALLIWLYTKHRGVDRKNANAEGGSGDAWNQTSR